ARLGEEAEHVEAHGGGEEPGAHERAAVGNREGARGRVLATRDVGDAARLRGERADHRAGARSPNARCELQRTARVVHAADSRGGKAVTSISGTNSSPRLLRNA